MGRQLALRAIFGEFCLPRRTKIFLARKRGYAMTKSHRFASVYSKDRCYGRSVRGSRLLSIALAVYMTGLAVGAQRTRVPDDIAITKAVESYFASQPGFQKGDLITRSQIEKVLTKLQAAGVKIPEADGIAKLGLADDSFIVRELSTADGRKFMRKIGNNPGAYSHLD